MRVEGRGDALLGDAVLDERAPAFEIALDETLAGDRLHPAASFFRLGVEHILTGFDHLLFLLALLVTCRGLGSAAKIISSFTVAHSITLVIATLGWLELPGQLVEPAIAASIVVAGVSNIRARRREPQTLGLAFGFGLIHGFGFAAALSGLGAAEGIGGVALPLALFNLGVEAGQIAIAGIALPLLWTLQRSSVFTRFGVTATSSAVAVSGLYWFLERVLTT